MRYTPGDQLTRRTGSPSEWLRSLPGDLGGPSRLKATWRGISCTAFAASAIAAGSRAASGARFAASTALAAGSRTAPDARLASFSRRLFLGNSLSLRTRLAGGSRPSPYSPRSPRAGGHRCSPPRPACLPLRLASNFWRSSSSLDAACFAASLAAPPKAPGINSRCCETAHV